MTQRMAKGTIFLSYLVLLYGRYVESDLFYDVRNKMDPCEAYCEKTYPGTTIANVSSDVPLFCKSRVFDWVLARPVLGRRSQNVADVAIPVLKSGFYILRDWNYACFPSSRRYSPGWALASTTSLHWSLSFVFSDHCFILITAKSATASIQFNLILFMIHETYTVVEHVNTKSRTF
jgi:hypothetical protein